MSRVVRAKVVGDRNTMRRLRDLQKKAPQAVQTALYREALRIFAVSQMRVPVDTGRLRSSGGVTTPGGATPLVVIYYGTVYGGIVHETHRSRSKYLEGPFLEAVPTMAARIENDTLRIIQRTAR